MKVLSHLPEVWDLRTSGRWLQTRTKSNQEFSDMANRLMVWLVSFALVLPLPLVMGCDGTAFIQEANAVTLESSLISMQNNILTYVVYKWMNIPLNTTAGL